MKRFLFLLLCLVSSYSFSAYALSGCERAVPTSDPKFCASFKSVTYCHCQERGMPSMLCDNMDRILKLMIATYGNLWNACSARAQKDAPQQECFDDWNFYTAHC